MERKTGLFDVFLCENLQFCSLLLIKVREVPAAANTNKSQRKLGAGSVFAKMFVLKPNVCDEM